jgi:hypothetical protein
MKKNYLFLMMLVSCWATAQTINFPDPNFKNALINNALSFDDNGNPVIIDVNIDGEIQVSEALLLKSIFIDVTTSSITDITGIENFANLRTLSIKNQNIATVNLTALINLVSIRIENSALTSLNLNGLNKLTRVDCSQNALTELDLSHDNIINNLRVENNNLTLLDLSGCQNLETLFCTNNQLVSLDFSQVPTLENFFANGNLLQYINLKNGNTYFGAMAFEENPNLAFVCIDEYESDVVKTYLAQNFPNCVVNSYCSFVPGGDYHTLTGTFKYDDDANGCDTNDSMISSQRFTINNGTTTDTVMTNAIMGYTLGLPAGTYTLAPLNPNPAYFTVEPASVILTLSDSETEDLHVQNYCLSPIGAFHDLDITILPIVPARPGFDAKYRIIYRNKGNTTQFAGISFNYNDDVLDFVSASMPASGGPGGLFWEIPNITPFEEGIIDITLNANAPTETPALNIDDILHFEANIQNPIPEAVEQTPLDNTYKLDQIVVGSYDPNDKTCVEGTTITPEMAGEYVTYMIRFENTGTYAAENVVVQDKIDLEKFEIGSLTPLRSSHPFVTRTTNGNNVEFIFENIMLPGMPSEERHGYVAFKIKTKATLQLNDTFSNTAAIYFDYNAPVITNEAVTTFAITQSNPDFDFNRYITIYPNPATTVLSLEVNGEIMIESLEVYNIMGQMVLTMPKANNKSAIDIASLASGTYILKVTSNKGTSNSKFIKK